MCVDLEDEVEISPLYHLSTLSGPIAMLAVISAECLIPLHNVLKEPQYWYEHILILTFGLMPFMISGTVNFAIYWAKFTFEKKWISYLEIVGVGFFTFLFGIFPTYATCDACNWISYPNSNDGIYWL